MCATDGGRQQRVEIVKALYRAADILFWTSDAVLTPQEGR